MANNLNRCKLNIRGVVEHRIVHEEDLTFIEQLESCTLITTNARRRINGAAAGSVINGLAEKALAKVMLVNDRIVTATFNGNPSTTVVNNYAPMVGSKDAEEHYKAMTNVINEITKHHVNIECSDFNAYLGEDAVPYTFHTETNNNGQLLLDHVVECNLCITRTLFKEKKGKQWMFISDMNGNKSQTDYILVNKKWKNSVHNVEPYNSFSSLGGNHHLVTARQHLSLCTSKTPATRNATIGLHCEIQNFNSFMWLQCLTELLNYPTTGILLQSKYGKFVQSNEEAATKLIPIKKRMKQRKLADDPRVEKAHSEVQEAFSNYQKAANNDTKQTSQRKKSL
ncbi:Hypothetical predicted protein [Octopus vulgaris]|uniref:Craniofacial development protein 2-like n=1 Tax=Octopus vulgaris TaxID=6645 RepID=A0AA36FC28_OCTVU|nr:Hypothetical predicted protein [Octopus vulgaris]